MEKYECCNTELIKCFTWKTRLELNRFRKCSWVFIRECKTSKKKIREREGLSQRDLKEITLEVEAWMKRVRSNNKLDIVLWHFVTLTGILKIINRSILELNLIQENVTREYILAYFASCRLWMAPTRTAYVDVKKNYNGKQKILKKVSCNPNRFLKRLVLS